MSPEDTKLKIRIASSQHSVDWGTGMASREIRAHSFRLGDEHGYQRAIDDLKEEIKKWDGDYEELVAALDFLESRQKELTNLQGQIPCF